MSAASATNPMSAGSVTNPPAVPFGGTIGILGSGQLGRLLALAAHRMGYRTVVLAPDRHAPAAQVAGDFVFAPYDDREAAAEVGRRADVVTCEFESIPVTSLAAASEHAPVFPTPDVHGAACDRIAERKRLDSADLPQTAHAFIETTEDSALERAIEQVGLPAVLKTAGQGYDGKGQQYAEDAATLGAAWESWGRPVCVLEGAVDLATELSVLVVTGRNGERCVYEAVENVHRHHILDHSLVPATLSDAQQREATDLAARTADAFATPGLICVEMFLATDGRLLVNEIAPRPHNSGHLTVEAHRTSQYEQLVRALVGLPLGSVARPKPAAMVNLLGDLWADGEPRFERLLTDPRIALCLYGKTEPRPGRKMGHFTAVADSVDAVEQAIDAARQRLGQTNRDADSNPAPVSGEVAR